MSGQAGEPVLLAERPRPAGRQAGPAGPRRAPRRARRGPAAALYLLPACVFLLVWVYLPLGFTAALSVLHWNLVSGSEPFAGGANYTALLSRPDFAAAAGHTVLYVAGLLPFATVFPMAMAIMLWKHPGRAATAYRGLIFLPVILAPVAVAVAWRFLLAPLQGLADTLLSHAGLPAPDWLASPGTALPVLVVITGAKIFALNVLIYLAGLAAIDRSYLEAARVDGAGEWAITRRLLVPLLSRTTALASFLCLVFGGQWAFVNIAVLTQGGPQGATSNVFYLLYQYGFSFFDAGLASAAGVVITLALAVAVAGHQLAARRLDSLKAAVASIADLADRQLELIVDEKFNEGLTPNLIPRFGDGDHGAGLHHGFKGMQLACSAVTAEALKGTMPASVFSRSTEAHNQDKVSMSPIAARDARAVIALTEEALAIHLLALCQALELRGLDDASSAAREIHGLIRERAAFVTADRAMDADIAAVLAMIRSGALTGAAARLAATAAPAAPLASAPA